MNDTLKLPRFTEGIDRGRVGMAWGGSIQCFIFSVTIDGALDPEWVAKQLGEKPPPKEDKKKKAPETGGAGKAAATVSGGAKK